VKAVFLLAASPLPREDVRLVFPHEFLSKHIVIFGHDPHEPVGILGMVADQLAQRSHLPFQSVKPPRQHLKRARHDSLTG
jgi:hypothetical protein